MEPENTPKPPFTPEQDERWEQFLEEWKEFANSRGYHPCPLDRPSMEVDQSTADALKVESRKRRREKLFRSFDRDIAHEFTEEEADRANHGPSVYPETLLRDVVSSYFPLQNDQAACPFCDDGTFRIEGDRWSCELCDPAQVEQCGSGGDVVEFVATYERCTRERAREMISRREQQRLSTQSASL